MYVAPLLFVELEELLELLLLLLLLLLLELALTFSLSPGKIHVVFRLFHFIKFDSEILCAAAILLRLSPFFTVYVLAAFPLALLWEDDLFPLELLLDLLLL